MATDMRRKTAYTDNRRSTQRNNVYVYGNTAKKLQAVPAEYDRPVRKVNHATKRNRERALHMNIGARSGICPDNLSDIKVRHYKQCQEYRQT